MRCSGLLRSCTTPMVARQRAPSKGSGNSPGRQENFPILQIHARSGYRGWRTRDICAPQRAPHDVGARSRHVEHPVSCRSKHSLRTINDGAATSSHAEMAARIPRKSSNCFSGIPYAAGLIRCDHEVSISVRVKLRRSPCALFAMRPPRAECPLHGPSYPTGTAG
jgi:hypothetical protein